MARKAGEVSGEGREVEPVSLGRHAHFVGFYLRRVQDRFSKNFWRARDRGLRSGMFSALELIRANPGISQTALSREVGMDKSAMATMITEMVARGWLDRKQARDDRRRNILTVSDEGEALLDRLFEDLTETEGAFDRALTPESRAMLLDSLDKLYQVVRQETD